MTETLRRAENSRVTYVYLRFLLILLPALLLVVTVGTAIYQRELETSISAYYGGPVRDVFVGCMVAAAACLVAYQGVGLLEDYALNSAGFYAIFVALVPNNFEETMSVLRANPSPDGLTAADYVAFLRIALTSVLVLCVVLFSREFFVGNPQQLWASNSNDSNKIDWVNRLFVSGTMLLLVGFLALAMWRLWGVPADEVTMHGLFQLRIHDIAAILLIGSLVVAVLTNTWPYYRFSELWKTGRVSYLIIFLLMTLGIAVPLTVAYFFAPGHRVILLEWWQIGLFAAFWLMETLRQLRVERRSLEDSPPTGPLREPTRAAVTEEPLTEQFVDVKSAG